MGGGLHPTASREVAERRRAEVASDVWEQRAAGRAAAAPAAVVALSILRRMVAGMAADLRWRRGQLAAARTGRPPQPRARPVASALARSRWLVIAGAGLLVLLGIAWRRRSPVTGNVLVGAGALPMLTVLPWVVTIVVMLAIVELTQASRVRALGVPAPSRSAHRVALTLAAEGAGVLIAYRLLAAGQEPAAFVPGLVLLGLVLVYAGLRWRRRAT